jgi:hypothetical protein
MLQAARQQLGAAYDAQWNEGCALPLPEAMAAAEAVYTTVVRNVVTAPL